jgi:hypothetical protein
MSEIEPRRNFRLLVSPYLNVGTGAFGYNLIDEGIRHVPPHPEDAGASTEPIDTSSGGFVNIAFQLGVILDFWQRVFVKYKFSVPGANVRFPMEDVEEGPYAPSCYNSYGEYGLREVCTGGGYPPEHRQRYESGENAYTFLSMGGHESQSHFLTVGFYPYHVENRKEGDPDYAEGNLSLEAGIAIDKFTVVRGWDRYASVEILDEKEFTAVGITGGISYLMVSNIGKFNLGSELGASLTFFFNAGFACSLNIAVPIGFDF